MAIGCQSFVLPASTSAPIETSQILGIKNFPPVRFLSYLFRSKLKLSHCRRRKSYGPKPWEHRESTRTYAAISNFQSSNDIAYVQIKDCLVYPPPSRKKRPKAILQFLGGAFIGAAPELTYSLFIELLAKDGFLVVAVPYNVTFDHSAAAAEIHRKFGECLDSLLEDGFSTISALTISQLPIFSVGHSNGALMQVLLGSVCKQGRLPTANAIISFNNKPAADAVPFFDQTGRTLSQISTLMETSAINDFAKQLTADGLRVLFEEPLPVPPGVLRENFESTRKFLRQIPGVIDQVAKGVTEFRPSPSENQQTVMNSYAIPHNFLVKFTIDTIDETDTLESIIKNRIEANNGSIRKVVLPGTHATPLAPDIKWKVGSVYTPVDAVAQLVRSTSIIDLTRLVRNISDWFETLNLQL